MKVKVGESVFDAENIPIMVILTPQDMSNIADMSSVDLILHHDQEATLYAAFPDSLDWSDEQKQTWMYRGIS